MSSHSLFRVIIVISLVMVLAGITDARSKQDTKQTSINISQALPAYCIAQHNIGQLSMSVTNHGIWGNGFYLGGATVDCFTGEPVLSCEYPVGSNTRYLFGASLWIGAVVNGDTLVSVGADGWIQSNELHPDEAAGGGMIHRSNLDPMAPEYEGAVSHQDYIAVFTDTLTSGLPGLTPDEVDGRPHIPLNVEVTQTSYAWSYIYTENFVLFEYDIKNIGDASLEDTYIGLWVDGDVFEQGTSQGYRDDVCGFLESISSQYGPCPTTDELNLAWIADNDGDDFYGGFKVQNVTGTRLLRFPGDDPQLSFNWWVSNGNPSLDFGPQLKAQFRDLGHSGVGTPAGDRNKYFFLRNGEIDYDQVFSGAFTEDDPVWTAPVEPIAEDLSNGWDTKYLLSIGPFDIEPGQTAPFAVAYVGGKYFHVNPNNYDDNLRSRFSYNPDAYLANLNFGHLAMNAMWADWVYDNPGVDTDSDGYAGEYRVCGPDTTWVSGDGVPDLRAAGAPPSPTLWLDLEEDALNIRWNGLLSETTPDVFSRDIDFEGYNLYLSHDGTPGSYALMASCDNENYVKYVQWPGGWQVRDDPFTLEELQCLYGAFCGDEAFDPLEFTSESPYVHPAFYDSVFYFEPFGINKPATGTGRLHKTYPDAPYPGTLNPHAAHPDELTDDGYFKYFEYEMSIGHLADGQCYYVTVTATDYGTVEAGIPPLESTLGANEQVACTPSPVEVEVDIMPGYCPNPFDVKLIKEEPDDPPEYKDPTRNLSLTNPPVVAVAILGTDEFDASQVDPTTVTFNGHHALRWIVADIATPLPQQGEPCECWTEGTDNRVDLHLKFYKYIGMLVPDEAEYGDQIPIEVKGNLYDGTPIIGSDCVLLVRPTFSGSAPSEPVLGDNYPNPFNPTTSISFSLPSASNVKLEIFNITGQRVKTLFEGHLGAGDHTYQWNADEVSSGVYIYRLETGQKVLSKKMTLVK